MKISYLWNKIKDAIFPPPVVVVEVAVPVQAPAKKKRRYYKPKANKKV